MNKLIVADTSPSILKTFALAFPEPEFEILPFAEGEKLLNEIDNIEPDGFFLNLHLPEKDGYEIARKLKSLEKYKKIPLFLLVGAFGEVDEKKLENLEFEKLIREPFDSEVLVKIVRNILPEKNNPQTFPEEPVFYDNPVALKSMEIEKMVKDLVRKEILGLERELELRIKARVLAELKDSVLKS